jgi:hypothetical protein
VCRDFSERSIKFMDLSRMDEDVYEARPEQAREGVNRA